MRQLANGSKLLEVSKLEVTYHRAVVPVQGVSFHVPESSVVAILGINGAGKTTVLRAITGFMGTDDAEVTDGNIIFEGEELKNRPPHEIARRGITLVPERHKIFVTLTVQENLSSSVPSQRGDSKQILDLIHTHFPILGERRNQVAGYLSGGERQMLAISRALLCLPRLLVIDELSLGLAPAIVSHLMETLRSLRQELGLTILLVEQNAAAALQIADHGYVMENGRVVFDDTPERLLQHDDVREFYLGIGEDGEKSYRDVKQYRRVRRWWG